MQKILLTFWSIAVLLCSSNAQQVIQPGDFRCISLHGPVMYYFKDARVIGSFTEDLDSILNKKRGYKLSSNTTIDFIELKNKQDINETRATTFPRISINVVEYSPYLYRKQFPQEVIDSVFAKDLLSVFLVEAILQTDEKTVSNSTVEIFVKQSLSNGMGISFANLHLTGKGFTELLKTSLAIVLDSSSNDAQIELKAAPAYLGDNFILSTTVGLPRVFFSNSKNTSRFNYNGQQSLLRWDEQRYREIFLAGKNKTVLSDSLLAALIKVRNNTTGIFVFLQQDARDVINNKNYRLEMPAYLYQNSNNDQSGLPIIEPLEGLFHYLINDEDTVARFSISTNIPDPNKIVFLHYSTNGIDSSTAFAVNNVQQAVPIKNLFQIKGIIRDKKMMINIGAGFREIYLNDKKVAIITGVASPDKMIIFDPEISSTFLNELLLIAYNSFLQ